MNEQPVSVTKVSWQDLCPWTNIFHTLSIATSSTVLVLALIGVVLTPMGWMLSELLFVNDEMRDNDRHISEMVDLNSSPYRGLFHQAKKDESNSVRILGKQLSGPRLVFNSIVEPFRMLFSGQRTARGYFYLLFGSMWSLLVWSFVGLTITRVAVLRLTRNERIGIDDAFDFAIDKFMTVISAIGMPLCAVIGLCIPAGIVGLLMTMDLGVAVFGTLWFVMLAISAIMGVLLLGLMFAWPLMVASTATEGQNSFDAMTRSYAYVFQRPLNCLFYAILAIVFGGICWLIVGQLTNGIIELSYWSASWGTNLVDNDRVAVLQGIIDPPPPIAEAAEVVEGAEVPAQLDIDPEAPTTTGSLRYGRMMIGFWNGLLRTVAAAFIYGLFWCMASAIYLLLRKDVDETAMDDVYLVDEKRTFDLPPLKSDENGIPQVQTPIPVDLPENSPNTGSKSGSETDRESEDA